jgi:Arm domain-containing DNA-binding protein
MMTGTITEDRAHLIVRRFTLGNYPAFKPADARRESARILEKVGQGADPLADKKALRNVRPPEQETFGALVQDYLERYAKKNTAASTYTETKRVLEGDDLKPWQKRPVLSENPIRPGSWGRIIASFWALILHALGMFVADCLSRGGSVSRSVQRTGSIKSHAILGGLLVKEIRATAPRKTAL